MKNRFKVNMGYNPATGKSRNRYFPTLEATKSMVGDYFQRTKIVLSIVEVQAKKKN